MFCRYVILLARIFYIRLQNILPVQLHVPFEQLFWHSVTPSAFVTKSLSSKPNRFTEYRPIFMLCTHPTSPDFTPMFSNILQGVHTGWLLLCVYHLYRPGRTPATLRFTFCARSERILCRRCRLGPAIWANPWTPNGPVRNFRTATGRLSDTVWLWSCAGYRSLSGGRTSKRRLRYPGCIWIRQT